MCTEDETGDKLVSVQLDDEESWLNFIDVPGSEVGVYVGYICACVFNRAASFDYFTNRLIDANNRL